MNSATNTQVNQALAHLNNMETDDGTLLMWAWEDVEQVREALCEIGSIKNQHLVRLLDHTLRDLEAARGHIDRATLALSGKALTDQP